jgi:radical SAM superfamily enzyme YgiQ (UPF0313 family)
MEIILADVFRTSAFRLSKDTNGGFGTEYKIQGNFFSTLLGYFVKKQVDTLQPMVSYILGGLSQQQVVGRYRRFVAGVIPQDVERNQVFLVISSIVCWESELEFCSQLSKTYPEIKIFLVGPFASTQPRDSIPANIGLIIGEPEKIVFNLDLLRKAERGDILDVGFIDELDELPLPNEHVIRATVGRLPFLQGPVYPILAKRGCPYSCSYYCTYPVQQGKKIRKHSVGYVLELIALNLSIGISSFIFRDPVFTIDKKWLRELCNGIISNNLVIEFCAEFHLRDLDYELVNLMRKAGLRMCYFGIESSNQVVLDGVCRQAIPDDHPTKMVKYLEAQGVICKAMYIFGLPGDTEETIEATSAFSRNLGSTLAQYSVFTPYPGTPAFNAYKINATKFEEYSQWDLIYESTLTKTIVEKSLNSAYFRFYSRPAAMFKILNKLWGG